MIQSSKSAYFIKNTKDSMVIRRPVLIQNLNAQTLFIFILDFTELPFSIG